MGVTALRGSGATQPQTILATPKLKITSDSYLNFWGMCSSTSNYLKIMYSNNKTDWQQLGNNITFNNRNTMQYFSIALSSLAGNNYYLGFQAQAGDITYTLDCVFGPEKVPEPPTLVSPANNIAQKLV